MPTCSTSSLWARGRRASALHSGPRRTGLNYLTLEREEVGGTVSKYPRQKLVMTSPVEFPLYGRSSRRRSSAKKTCLRLWEKIMPRADLNIKTGTCVESILKEDDGLFNVRPCERTYSSRAVIMALGRAGTPRKLGVHWRGTCRTCFIV